MALAAASGMIRAPPPSNGRKPNCSDLDGGKVGRCQAFFLPAALLHAFGGLGDRLYYRGTLAARELLKRPLYPRTGVAAETPVIGS
jgi:hypothetical protein